MRRFPDEFADLLNAKGRAFLRRRKPIAEGVRAFFTGVPYIGFRDFLDGRTIQGCYDLCQRAFDAYAFNMHKPLPKTEVECTVTPTQHNRSIFFHEGRPEAQQRALEMNYPQMMRSSSAVELVHRATGLPVFVAPDQSAQVSVYDEGDYVGPHADAKGQNGRLHPFIDFHISLPNRHVQAQWLLYEREPGFMTGMIDLNVPGNIGVYRLPLWHQVTPLQAKPGRTRQARRWLMMGWMGIEGHNYFRVGRDFRYFPEDAELKPLHRAGPPPPEPAGDVVLVEALASMLSTGATSEPRPPGWRPRWRRMH